MNLRQKQKRIISLVVTFAMLFSSMGMAAAAEPAKRDAPPTIAVDAEPGATFAMAVDADEEGTTNGTE